MRVSILAYALALGLPLCSLAQSPASGEGFEAQLIKLAGEKKGVTLHVNGQTLGGAVVRVEPGHFVELRGPQGQRIVVRLERVDALSMYP